MTQTDPLLRQKGEPNKANQRLQLYAKFAGNMKQFKKHLHEHHKDLEVKYHTLHNESSKWKWQERKKQYKQQQEQQLRDEIEDLFQSLNKAGITDMSTFFNDINELRTDLMRRFRANEITSTNALRVLKDYIKLYREATEIYYINSRHALFPQEQDNAEQINSAEAIMTFVDSLRLLRNNGE